MKLLGIVHCPNCGQEIKVEGQLKSIETPRGTAYIRCYYDGTCVSVTHNCGGPK